MAHKNVNKTVYKLLLVSAGMFAFGYALVPLYRVYCDLIGRGSNRVVSETVAGMSEVDETRLVTVVFDTNTRDIPWSFRAERHKAKVRLGELSEAVFTVENRSGETLTGRAIPSVSPVQAGAYLNKMDCFCFSEQVLAPKERREMQVRFIVGADLPERFSSLTLSYTFFNLDDRIAGGTEPTQPVNS